MEYYYCKSFLPGVQLSDIFIGSFQGRNDTPKLNSMKAPPGEPRREKRFSSGKNLSKHFINTHRYTPGLHSQNTMPTAKLLDGYSDPGSCGWFQSSIVLWQNRALLCLALSSSPLGNGSPLHHADGKSLHLQLNQNKEKQHQLTKKRIQTYFFKSHPHQFCLEHFQDEHKDSHCRNIRNTFLDFSERLCR